MQEKWKKFVVSGFPSLQWKKVIILVCFSVSGGRMFSLQGLFLQVGLWLGSFLYCKSPLWRTTSCISYSCMAYNCISYCKSHWSSGSEACTRCFSTSANSVSSSMSKTTLKRQWSIMDSIIARITYVTSVLLFLLIIFKMLILLARSHPYFLHKPFP